MFLNTIQPAEGATHAHVVLVVVSVAVLVKQVVAVIKVKKAVLVAFTK